MTKFLREEDKILQELTNYIEGTYTSHYKTDGELQTVDIWESLGIAEDVCKGTALKYIMRFGKKDGKNIRDLYKAMHYLVLMAHYARQHEQDQAPVNGNSIKGSDNSWAGYFFSKTITAPQENVGGIGYIPERSEKTTCKYNIFSKQFWKHRG